jgi:hypothetical protein
MYGAWRGNLSFSPERGRVAQGVYRMARAPRQDHEAIYATWLAGVRLRIRRDSAMAEREGADQPTRKWS